MNRYQNIISEIGGNIEKIVLNKEIKKRGIAANGIILPPPSKGELISIIFFLQYDENEKIAKMAQKKFLTLPIGTIMDGLNETLNIYVLNGTIKYLITKEDKNLDLFKKILKNKNFDFKILKGKLDKIDLSILSFMAEALSVIMKNEEIVAELLKTSISKAQKQKIIDFAIRNEIEIPIKGFQKLKEKFETGEASIEEIEEKKEEPLKSEIKQEKNKELKKEINKEKVDKKEVVKNRVKAEPIPPLTWDKIIEKAKEPIASMLTHPKRAIIAKIKPMKPEEKVTLLYYLTFDPDETVSISCKKTIDELPDNIIESALSASSIDYYVLGAILDTLVKQGKLTGKLFERIIFNRSFHYGVLQSRISFFTTDQIDLISNNTSALMENPNLIAEIYDSENTRASTAQKLLEFSFRHDITLPIENYEDLKNAFENGETTTKDEEIVEKIDEVFEKYTEKIDEDKKSNKEEDIEVDNKDDQEEEKVENVVEERKSLIRIITEMNIAQKVKFAMKGNMEARSILIKASNRMVLEALIRNPMITDQEIAKWTADKNTSQEVIRYIANNKKWLKKYQVKYNIVIHPKAPSGRAMRLLSTLRIKDIKTISKSKGIPTIIRRAANEHIQKLEKKKKKKK